MVTKEAWLGHRDEFGDPLWKKSCLPHWLTYGRKIYCICVLVNRCPVWLLSHACIPKSVVILGTSNHSRDLLCKRTWWLGLPGCTSYWAFPHAHLMSSNNFFFELAEGIFPLCFAASVDGERLFVPVGVICQVMLWYFCNMSPLFFANFAKFSNPKVIAHQGQKVADTLLISLALQTW